MPCVVSQLTVSVLPGAPEVVKSTKLLLPVLIWMLAATGLPFCGVASKGAPGAVITSVNCCVAAGETPLSALRHSVYVPASPSAGVPEIVAVPSPLSTNDTVPGRVDELHVPKVALVIVAVGLPVVVTL